MFCETLENLKSNDLFHSFFLREQFHLPLQIAISDNIYIYVNCTWQILQVKIKTFRAKFSIGMNNNFQKI